MVNKVIFAPGHEIEPGWRWRDANNHRWLPSEMATRHLFHTLRMLWNNFMPTHMRVGKIKLYRFPTYTRDYLGKAIIAIGRELMQRDDLTEEWLEQLQQMQVWLAKPHLLENKSLLSEIE